VSLSREVNQLFNFVQFSYIFFHGLKVLVGLGHLIFEVLGLLSDTPHFIVLLCASDRPVGETYTLQRILHSQDAGRQTYMASAGFEPQIPASERLQTHDLERAATAIIKLFSYVVRYFTESKSILKKCNEGTLVELA
jgi:hypothetical protein